MTPKEKPQEGSSMNDGTQSSKEVGVVPPEVQEHVVKMRIPVDNKKAKCVDGGYKEHESVGALAIPGGHLGISMALLRLGYGPLDAFHLVYDFARSQGMKYSWHTDQHEGHNGVVCGCGHCNAAIHTGNEYGLNGAEVQQLLDIVREKTASDPEGMECVILDREHTEQGILVITGTEFTVKPWDQTANRQYFIYDQTRHQEYLAKLAEFLQKQGKETSYEELWNASSAHTDATLGLLASSKNKPMYVVNVDGEQPVIEYLKNAPVR